MTAEVEFCFCLVKREANDSAIRYFEAALEPARSKYLQPPQTSCGFSHTAPGKSILSRHGDLRRARWYALRAASFPARFSSLREKRRGGRKV
jgi:hypothetical protein